MIDLFAQIDGVEMRLKQNAQPCGWAGFVSETDSLQFR